MSKNPYRDLPARSFWRRAVSSVAYAEVDPVGEFALRVRPETKVATAGSCFAQHIARHLAKNGFNYHVVERGHPVVDEAVRIKHQYGTFSARYGNIYTARQLLQLIERAYGRFEPAELPWIESGDQVLDPFRPNVEPDGFVSVAAMNADRAQHLAAVREMFETLDVFVFTLGLTECWRSRADGAVFPVCPGVAGGAFDAAKYSFHNQDVAEVVSDFSRFMEALKAVNRQAQVVLTVSPVPLMATATPGEHVLSATTYSKSVLRVAAETLRRSLADVHYFPSYEIITGSYAHGRYFVEDLRNVTEEGVSHVMRLFLAHATGATSHEQAPSRATTVDNQRASAELFVETECDEAALDPGEPRR
jgi:hypothetical protein